MCNTDCVSRTLHVCLAVTLKKRGAILIISAKMRNQAIKRCFIFPFHPSIASVLLAGEHKNTKIASFSSPVTLARPPTSSSLRITDRSLDTCSRNRRQKTGVGFWRRFFKPVAKFLAPHGRIKTNQTFYFAIRPTMLKD